MKSTKRKSINIKKRLQDNAAKLENNTLIYSEPLTVSQFCEIIDIPANKIIQKAFLEGKMLTINTFLSDEELGELCIENGFDFKKNQKITFDNFLDNVDISNKEYQKEKRPPIITIMGHVDHGKTTLLDTIRKTNVAEGEKGQITQHIGAYQTKYKDQYITFLDTPGHEAFAQMRIRGASLTDIVIIVVSAVDGIKPQTIESKDHALKANLPIIVAINKCDLPNADPEKIKKELMNHDLIAEEFGGNVIFKNISAKTGDGIDELLETILLVSEINDYKASDEIFAFGNVLESHIDKALGPVATLLITTGVLKEKDALIVGSTFGKVRLMLDYNNKKIKEAGPSTPVVVSGLQNVPDVGSKFMAFENEKEAKKLAQQRLEQKTINQRFHSKGQTIQDLSTKMAEAKLKNLNLIIKTNVSGSIQAIEQLINKIDVENTKINIIKSSIGVITESDVLLAKTSNAIIYGFNIKPSAHITNEAIKEKVEINTFWVIYDLKEHIIDKLNSLIKPKSKLTLEGEGEVIAVFNISKLGVIAGTRVTNGVIKNNHIIKIIRDNEEIFEGKIKSLKIEKNDTKEAKKGLETGIFVNGFNEFVKGDIIQTYLEEKT